MINIKELIDSIETFTDNYNEKSKPFVWTANAESILHKIERLCKSISGTGH